MTYDQVLVFHKIVELGSFKAAAAELNKTQPAISLSIKKLEEEMEALLFDRSSYRPTLTPHGHAFFEKSFRILHGMNDLESLTKSFRNKEEPEISIAVDGISPLPDLLKLFKTFSDQYVNTRLNLSFEILSETETRVLNREVQFGITHFLSENKDSLEIIPITHVKMIPVMSRELFEERSVKTQLQLGEIDQIVVGEKSKSKTTFGILDQGRKWRLMDNNFKREIIFAGLGWGHMPEHTIKRELEENKLVILNFEDIHPRVLTINLIRLRKNHMGPVARQLWDKLSLLSHRTSM